VAKPLPAFAHLPTAPLRGRELKKAVALAVICGLINLQKNYPTLTIHHSPLFLITQIIGPGIHKVHYVDIAHSEGGFAVAEVVVPFADKGIIKTQRLYFAEAEVKLIVPKL
jgi:hypothetical protein